MGANIGTTVTAWIVSMSEWGSMLKPETFAPLLIGIGAFMLLFCKKWKAEFYCKRLKEREHSEA